MSRRDSLEVQGSIFDVAGRRVRGLTLRRGLGRGPRDTERGTAPAGSSPGQVLVLFALMSTALMGILGLSIDLGYTVSQRRSMQNAADLAAIAGAHSVAEYRQDNIVSASTSVQAVIDGNQTREGSPAVDECMYVNDDLSDVASCDYAVPADATGVRVKARETHDTFFIQIVPGAPNQVTTTASATARVELLFRAGMDSPFIVCGYGTKLADGSGELDILLNDDTVNPEAIHREFRVVGDNTARLDQGDKDGDGLANDDLQEPNDLDADTDDGGVSDGAEVALGTNPLDPRDDDPDGDGLGNDVEADLGTSGGDPDTDDGGMSDGDEFTLGLDPTNGADDDHDSDDGGLPDAIEADLGLDPTDAADDDGDSDDGGLSDADEADAGLDPFNSADDDGDSDDGGLPDALDPNPGDPADDDGDTDDGGLPDVVDPDPGDPADDARASDDPDGDGLGNGEEDGLDTDRYDADTDGGGVSDSREVDRGTNPRNDGDDDADDEEDDGADSDGDGLSNGEEADRNTDPMNADTDNGGVSDGAEVDRGTNPRDGDDEDRDGDGLSNDEEGSRGTDPRSRDSDGGGIPDDTEVARGTDPTDGGDDDRDADNGGVVDDTETARGTDPNDASDDARDSDGGGIANVTEAARGTDPDDASDDDFDTDNGGALDFTEIARGTDPADADDDVRDTDGGGVIDEDEAAFGTDPADPADDDRDTDNGGVTDAAETAMGTDPADAADDNGDGDVDADGDGDIDGKDDDAFTAAEEATAGTNPGSPDTDGDGFGDGIELAGGTDPLVAEVDEIANCGLSIPNGTVAQYEAYNAKTAQGWWGFAENKGSASPNNDDRAENEEWYGRKGRSAPDSQRFTVDGVDGCYGSNQSAYPAVNANDFSSDLEGNCILAVPVFVSGDCKPGGGSKNPCTFLVTKILGFKIAKISNTEYVARLMDDYPTFGGSMPGWTRDSGGTVVIKLKE